MSSKSDPIYCPKSDEGVKKAVKQGCLVVGLGSKATADVADRLRDALAHRARPGDGWEESKVLHLVLVVECSAINGDCDQAALKFMRQVRSSDGYGTYSEIIGRRVAVLALGKMGKVAGASKVEETLLKRGGCQRLVKLGRAEIPVEDVADLAWTRELCEALDATMDLPKATTTPARASLAVQSQAAAEPSACATAPVVDGSGRSSGTMRLALTTAAATLIIGALVASRQGRRSH